MCKNWRGGGRRGETKGEKVKGKEDKKSERLSKGEKRQNQIMQNERREWGRRE